MINSYIKQAYLKSKTSAQELSQNRLDLGAREIKTLELLAREVGFSCGLGCRVLDLGCADRFIEPVSLKRGWDYIGLDYDDVDFESEDLPLRDNSVDIAMSLAVIEHLRDPGKFISEIFRCLRPGGLVYLSTPNFQYDWRNFYNDPTHVRPYTPASMEALLRLSGYLNVATFPGVRCKSIWWYRGALRFFKAYYLLPFRADSVLPVPRFLKGHARSIFALGVKRD